MLNITLILLITGILLFIIGICIAGSAHDKFDKIIEKFSSYKNSQNLNTYELLTVCIKMLGQNTEVYYHADDELGDCYYSSSDKIVLNKKTFYGKSIVDIAIGTHELGHSIQKNNSSVILFFTRILQILNSLLAGLFLPLILLGLIVYIIPFEYSFVGEIFIIIGIASFVVGLLLKILLIPLEYDASRRAQKFLRNNVPLTKQEIKIIKKVHKKALLTYVASLFEKPYLFFSKLLRR